MQWKVGWPKSEAKAGRDASVLPFAFSWRAGREAAALGNNEGRENA